MKTRFPILALAVSLLAVSSAAYALPCGEGKGGCIWNSDKATFALTEGKDALTLTSTVQGCAGMRSAHQDRIAAKAAKANKGEACCASSPFAAKGLKYKVENTELGAIVTITGPAGARTEFKKLFDAKMEARKAGTSCGCGKAEGSCGGCKKAEGTCGGCDKAAESCGCQKDKGSCGAAKAEKKSCGCGK